MVLDIGDNVTFHCYGNGVDMRKGVHSLYGIIKTAGGYSPFNGDAFVFIGTNLKSVKIIRWHNEGFLLYYKKLEVVRHILPRKRGDKPFFELKSSDADKLMGLVKHNNTTNEFKRAVFLTL